MISCALPLIALSLGLESAAATEIEMGRGPAMLCGATTGVVAFLLWIVAGSIIRDPPVNVTGPDRVQTSLNNKIQTLLTEARVILPGAQALLGFQLVAMISEKFDALPWRLASSISSACL